MTAVKVTYGLLLGLILRESEQESRGQLTLCKYCIPPYSGTSHSAFTFLRLILPCRTCPLDAHSHVFSKHDAGSEVCWEHVLVTSDYLLHLVLANKW